MDQACGRLTQPFELLTEFTTDYATGKSDSKPWQWWIQSAILHQHLWEKTGC